ncbi:Uncharacterised protein [Vibrio cholerae]|nr:Uncharacterised protein [Vibrio cholerae]
MASSNAFTDNASILHSMPLLSAACCIFFTNILVDIPALQQSRIFFMLYTSLV